MRRAMMMLVLGVVAACSVSDDDMPMTMPDPFCDRCGMPEPFPNGCNPIGPPGQNGCAAGEKCTWLQVQETPEQLGRVACRPDGTVPIGGTCTEGAVGEATGFDDCVSGAICIGGTCRDICGFDGSAGAACPTGNNCVRFDGLFANGEDDPVAGACDLACDPLTQRLSDDSGDCGAGRGCYLLTSQTDTVAVCASAGTVQHDQDLSGAVFANSCVPGAQPRSKDETGMTRQCGGLCRPADVTSTTNLASEGGVEPDSCQTRWGARPPADGTAGESCRYWWAREPFEGLSSYSNTVGWCFKHAVFQYDSNGDTTNDTPFPRCSTLTTGDVVPPITDPPHNDARYFWCVAEASTLRARARAGADRSETIGNWRGRRRLEQ